MSRQGRIAISSLAALAVAATIGGAGCGDPLVSNATYESPLLSFQPYVPELFQVASLDGLSVGIVWVDPLQLRDDLPHPAGGITVHRSDRDFTVDVFTPPPDAAIRRLPDPTTHEIAVSFAFGEIVVYADNNGDGRFALAPRAAGSTMLPPDEYAGSSPGNAVIYVETPAKPSGPVAPGWFTLFEAPGYRLVSIGCDVSLVSPPVRTVEDDKRFGLIIAPASSPTRGVARPCLSSVPVELTPP
ncbi:MAG TPA: hypothetical protein VNO55_04080 [Polyangia bacterium]|nr:hypothetical protein [Polyangia bacterium]